MRAGAITLQHTLTTEAASVLKHSLSLARKRGHAQVTPLHVATILLSSKTSLLRRACLKSHAQTTSHPLLHSRALELCFSVALNRLPATPGLLLHGQPCISNALVAALKRAQSQQRKGCVEQQQQQLLQQPLLAVKVELEQLILSILDDPSVSRVMREAGFSSSLAKNNLEDSASVSPVSQYCYNSSSGGVYSTPCSPKYAAVSLPSGGLGLSLNATSVHEPRVASTYNLFQLLDRKPCTIKEEQDRLACCVECTTNYEKEVSMLKSNQQHQLSWILPQGSDSLQRDNLTELRRKWSRLCHSIHRGRHIWNHLDSSLLDQQSYMGKNSYTSSYLGWPNQNGASPSNNSIYSTQYNHSASSVPRFRRQQSCHIEYDFNERNQKHQVEETSLVSLKSREGKEVKVTLALGNTLSSSSWEGERKTIDEGEMRKLLQENVPWQSEIIPSIVQVMIRNSTSIKNKNTWLLINGNDSVGKRRLALAIAEAVFGSATSLLCMNMRKRDNKLSQCSTMLQRTLSSSKNMVVLLEDIDYADAQFIDFISKGLKNGNFSDSSEDRGETIFILTKGDPSQYLEDDSNTTPIIQMKLQLGSTTPKSDGKRKAECELHIQSKTARIWEKGADTNATLDSHIGGKDLPRRSSYTILDLNIIAYDECDDQAEGENSPISSDVTFETANDPQSLFGFLDSIENKFTFNQENEKMRESFLSKFRRSFESTEDNHTLSVDEEVLGALSVRCSFLNSLFDEWLKDVFQTRLKTIITGGKEATSCCIRLCFEGKEGCIEDGFMCSNLPKRIH